MSRAVAQLFAPRPREAFAVDEAALAGAILALGARPAAGAAAAAPAALSEAGARMMDKTCRVDCADCAGGEYRMAYTSGLERAAGPDVGRNVCAFLRADGVGRAAAPAQGSAVPSMADCTRANSNAFVAGVVASLEAGNLDGRDQCVVRFAPGRTRAEYAAYEAGLRRADVLASQPYQSRWALWDSNDRAINGKPGGYLYRIADRTRMVYGPLQARVGDAVTAGEEYDLERRLTAATSNADGYRALWDECERKYKVEYSDPGACKDQLAWCQAALAVETRSNAALDAKLKEAKKATQAVRDDIAANYVLSTDCDAAKAASYTSAYDDELRSFADWISRAECDRQVEKARTTW